MHHFRTLSNGLRLVTIPLHDTRALTVFVFVKVGSRYETRSVNGASHFLEHLMFKGTKRRPNSLALTKLLDGVGASYNAFTSKDRTAYYVKANAEHAELAFDVLADMTRNSLFRPVEIERERGVILEEIKMYDENPVMSIDDIYEEIQFGDHHPLGRNILGPKKVIQGISRARLLAYKDRYYHAGNMWVVVAGRLPAKTNEYVQRYFGSFPKRRATPKFQPYLGRNGATIRIQRRPTEQVQLALGVRGLRYRDAQLPTLAVLTNILGGTMSSRLFLEVREKRGLAYSISAANTPYEDTGAVTIYAGLDKDKINDALRVMITELRRLKQSRVAPAELKRAKENLRGRTILDLEDSDALAGWYGRQALFAKKIQSPEVVLHKIAAVTSDDIRRLAEKLFIADRLRLAVIGPYTDDRAWRPILRSL